MGIKEMRLGLLVAVIALCVVGCASRAEAESVPELYFYDGVFGNIETLSFDKHKDYTEVYYGDIALSALKENILPSNDIVFSQEDLSLHIYVPKDIFSQEKNAGRKWDHDNCSFIVLADHLLFTDSDERVRRFLFEARCGIDKVTRYTLMQDIGVRVIMIGTGTGTSFQPREVYVLRPNSTGLGL